MTSPEIPKGQTAIGFDTIGGPLNTYENFPVVQPADLAPGQVLVNVKYTGVCHTDLHVFFGDWPVKAKLPLCGGHEGAGQIVAIGEGTTTDLKIGDRVGLKWVADSCLECEACRKGYEYCCPKVKNHGFTIDGTFKQYTVSYARHVTKIPDELPLEQAAPILCAGLTVWSAICKAECKAGDWIAIVGAAGGLGHLACQYAAAIGLKVVAIDSGASQHQLCNALGVEKFIDYRAIGRCQSRSTSKEACDGVGPHACIVAANSASSYQQAYEMLRPTGTLVAVGLPDIEIKAKVLCTVFQAKRIVGSLVGNRQQAIEALDLAARGKVRARIQIKPLTELGDVFHAMQAGQIAGRVVLKC